MSCTTNALFPPDITAMASYLKLERHTIDVALAEFPPLKEVKDHDSDDHVLWVNFKTQTAKWFWCIWCKEDNRGNSYDRHECPVEPGDTAGAYAVLHRSLMGLCRAKAEQEINQERDRERDRERDLAISQRLVEVLKGRSDSRPIGFYWVKRNGEWEVAYYSGLLWTSVFVTNELCTSDFDDIGGPCLHNHPPNRGLAPATASTPIDTFLDLVDDWGFSDAQVQQIIGNPFCAAAWRKERAKGKDIRIDAMAYLCVIEVVKMYETVQNLPASFSIEEWLNTPVSLENIAPITPLNMLLSGKGILIVKMVRGLLTGADIK